MVPDETREAIEKKIAELKKANPKKKGITALVVEGSEDDEKDLYVGYFCRPGAATFTKYLAAIQADNTLPGSRMLAKETFIEGDREMIDDDDLFIFGLMPQLQQLTKTRQGSFVNLSKPRK